MKRKKEPQPFWQCGICKKTFPAKMEDSPEKIVPAEIIIKINNEEHHIPICNDCLKNILNS